MLLAAATAIRFVDREYAIAFTGPSPTSIRAIAPTGKSPAHPFARNTATVKREIKLTNFVIFIFYFPPFFANAGSTEIFARKPLILPFSLALPIAPNLKT